MGEGQGVYGGLLLLTVVDGCWQEEGLKVWACFDPMEVGPLDGLWIHRVLG